LSYGNSSPNDYFGAKITRAMTGRTIAVSIKIKHRIPMPVATHTDPNGTVENNIVFSRAFFQ
jgi:hypothetical protein